MIIEYATGSEMVTATMTQPDEFGQYFQEPVVIGHYSDVEVATDDREIWIACEDAKINVRLRNVPELIKQLKRAAKLSSEQA